jgi:hypothetical protein
MSSLVVRLGLDGCLSAMFCHEVACHHMTGFKLTRMFLEARSTWKQPRTFAPSYLASACNLRPCQNTSPHKLSTIFI